MLKFIAKDRQTNVLTEEGGIMLGYIDENNVFFPNNHMNLMMFKIEWLEEIVDYIHKHSIIDFGEIFAYYEIRDVES